MLVNAKNEFLAIPHFCCITKLFDAMKTLQLYSIVARSFVFLSVLSLAYVALLAMVNPQAVMDLVGVSLPNTDAISSIRGIYGGVGITLCIVLVYLGCYHVKEGLLFLSLFWGSYAVSRFITSVVEGALGDFGNTWIVIEACFCFTGIVLLLLNRKLKAFTNA